MALGLISAQKNGRGEDEERGGKGGGGGGGKSSMLKQTGLKIH